MFRRRWIARPFNVWNYFEVPPSHPRLVQWTWNHVKYFDYMHEMEFFWNNLVFNNKIVGFFLGEMEIFEKFVKNIKLIFVKKFFW